MWNLSVSSLLIALAPAAEVEPGVLTPLKTIELNLPPGERSVVELFLTTNHTLKVVTAGKRLHTLELDLKTRQFASAPVPLNRPADAVALLRDSSGEVNFYLNRIGNLMVAELPNRTNWIDAGKVAGVRPKEKDGWQLSAALVMDNEGNVLTAGKDGTLFRYTTKTARLEPLKARLPCVKGREPWASLDAAVLHERNVIYGGTFDGYLFALDAWTQSIAVHGKPLRQQRIQGLAVSKGKHYGVGGEPDGMPRVFAFDPQSRTFEIGGLLRFGTGTYDYIMEPIGAMVADREGNIFLGSTGRLGNLFVWEAGK